MKKIFGSILPSSFQPLFGGIGFGSLLYDLAQAKPSLDLRFAENKSLVDATTGAQLVTFTRASSGTFVGSDGVLQTAVTNLLLRSEDLTTTWTKDAGVTITADLSQGQPFPGAQVFRVNYTGVNQSGPSQNNTYLAVPYAASVWIKGTPGETIRFTGQATVAAADFTLTGNWQRLSLAWTGTATAQAFSINTFNAVTARTIYVAAPQLEQSATVGEYIPTTSTINSAPRFDHNPTTGESLGLLVEEQRTNNVLQSEDFSTTWGTINYTVTANAATAPNGTATADKLIRNTTNTTTSVTQNVTVTANTAYNYSVFVKASEWSKVGLREGSASGNYVTFDLSNGTIVSSSVATGAITAFSNGWYRISMQMTTGAAQTTYGVRLIPLPDSYTSGTPSYSFAGDGTSGLLAWGAQLEAGAFPTSYIPTTTAAATRSADVASIEGSNFSSWYRQDEGTMFAEMDRNTAISTLTTVVSINDNSANNRLYNFRQDSASALTVISVTGGTLDASPGVTLANTSNRNRVAAAQSLNNLAAVANGGTAVPDTSVAMPTVNQVQIGNVTGTSFFNGTIRRLTYWPTRLPNNTLQSITQ